MSKKSYYSANKKLGFTYNQCFKHLLSKGSLCNCCLLNIYSGIHAFLKIYFDLK
jgi:hypothetical protein